jgi:membrane protease YdiL (CAAX protease family)
MVVQFFLMVLLIPGFGGAWEEPGWRGFALPRMQARLPALTANLLLGAIHALWHLPLFVTGEMGWAEAVTPIFAAIPIAWLFNHTRGSSLHAMLIHAANNTTVRLFLPLFERPDLSTLAWLFTGMWAVAAIAVVILAGPARLSRAPLVAPDTMSDS